MNEEDKKKSGGVGSAERQVHKLSKNESGFLGICWWHLGYWDGIESQKGGTFNTTIKYSSQESPHTELTVPFTIPYYSFIPLEQPGICQRAGQELGMGREPDVNPAREQARIDSSCDYKQCLYTEWGGYRYLHCHTTTTP